MSMTEVIESIEKGTWKQIDHRTIGEDTGQEMIDCTTLEDEPENPRYCYACDYYLLETGNCMNPHSDYFGDFRNLDDTCGLWEESWERYNGKGSKNNRQKEIL